MKECGNIQLCLGLKAGIDGATKTMGERIRERERTDNTLKERGVKTISWK